MTKAGLAFDDIPPLRVPLQFFLTAPLFGVLAGVLWSSECGVALALRWSQGTLAATHLFTLGFMAMVMVGALFQVVPVLGGGTIPCAQRVAPVVHAALTSGTLCLAWGLFRAASAWLIAAVVLLGIAFLVFSTLLGMRVLRAARGGSALYSLRFAVLSLVVATLLGTLLALARVCPEFGINYRAFTDAHAAWGLLG